MKPLVQVKPWQYDHGITNFMFNHVRRQYKDYILAAPCGMSYRQFRDKFFGKFLRGYILGSMWSRIENERLCGFCIGRDVCLWGDTNDGDLQTSILNSMLNFSQYVPMCPDK